MESYSVLNHFGGIIPNISFLHNEISSLISTDLRGVNLEDDNVNIFFSVQISPLDKINLDNLIAKYRIKYFPLFLKLNSINSNSFKRICLTEFPSIKYANVKAISYMDSSCTSYDILFYDKTNQTTLLNVNLNNTTEISQILGHLSSISSNSFELEVSIKKNGGNSNSNINIDSIVLEIL